MSGLKIFTIFDIVIMHVCSRVIRDLNWANSISCGLFVNSRADGLTGADFAPSYNIIAIYQIMRTGVRSYRKTGHTHTKLITEGARTACRINKLVLGNHVGMFSK